ncbi:MAG: DUF2188 domain-containing protein [Bacilli bacterium]|nr:DUF2188 domain-containing protein [Bacilli bacterium]
MAKETKQIVKQADKKSVVKQTDKKPAVKKTEVKKVEAKKETKAVDNKVYHISKRKEDGKWQVKFASGEKAIKLFDTQVEAIKYTEKMSKNQDASMQIHKVDGKIRKQDYSKK